MVIVKGHDIESSNWPSSISRLLEGSVNAIKITSHIKLRSFDKNTLLKGKSLSPLRQVCSSKTHRHKLAKLCSEQGASFTQLCITPHTLCDTNHATSTERRNIAAHAQTRISFPRKSFFCVKPEKKEIKTDIKKALLLLIQKGLSNSTRLIMSLLAFLN